MNFKIFLICVLVVQVRSDCDDYYTCLSGFVKNLFGNNNVTNRITDYDYNDFNDTKNSESVSVKNESVNFFDLSDIGKSLNDALTDVTTLITDEIKGIFNIEDQTDVHKEIENKTEIHVRAFSLSKIDGNKTEINSRRTETTIPIPEIIINNLTRFNDELNALKVEIEKQLQDEIESFISQVLESDSVDWIDATENSLYDVEFSTTEKPYPDFKDAIESTTQNFIDDEIKTVASESSKIADDETLTKVSFESRINSEEESSSYPSTPNSSTTTASLLTTNDYKINKNLSTVAFDAKLPEKNETDVTTKDNNKPTDEIFNITEKSQPESRVTSEIKITTTTVKTQDITTTTIQPITAKNLDKPKESINHKSQTKSPINYKLLENFKNNEITKDDPTYYDIIEDNVTDYPIIDYIDLYKDTTNEDIDYVSTVTPDVDTSDLSDATPNESVFTNNGSYTNDTSSPASIFPWVAAIFIKDSSSNQFDYYCDGILLSNTVVLTAARCLQRSNQTVNAEDVIVFLGKRSLQSSGEREAIVKIKQLTLHPNFTLQEDTARNDLAVLHLEEPAVFSEGIQPACLLDDGATEDAVTTAWSDKLSGIHFVEKNQTCEGKNVENTFCATYGLTVALCPSYGGVYAAKQSDRWCAGGIRTADPSNRGLCFDKTVVYTDLSSYRTWIDKMIK